MTDSFKPLFWIGSSKKDLMDLPTSVIEDVGYELYLAQCGDKSPSAKPLKGFGGASVLEVIQNHDGNTFRAVYTVRFAEAIYVLHVFQKKSQRGKATPHQDMDLVRTRLAAAEERHRQWQNERTNR